MRGAQEPLAAEVNARLRESTLRGRPLTGNIAASLRGEDLNIAALSLRGDDFTVKAQGRLQERLDFNAEVNRLGGLLPNARGSFTARGWTRWRDQHLSGRLVASGRDLAVAGARVARLSLAAEHREKGTPVAIEADLAKVVFRDWRLDSAGLRMRGTVEEHALQLSLAGPDMQLRAAASGGYDGA